MSKYRKFIVALVGTVLAGLAAFDVVDLTAQQEAITVFVISLLTSLGVFATPNKETE